MRHSPAFTLIELIIVLALIGLLTGLGYTQFSKFQESSAQNLAMSQIKNYFNLARSLAISRQVPPGSTWTDIDSVMVSISASTKKIDVLGKNGVNLKSYLAQPADITGGVSLNFNSGVGMSVEFNKYKGDINTGGQNCRNSGGMWQDWCVELTNNQEDHQKCLETSQSGLVKVLNKHCDYQLPRGGR